MPAISLTLEISEITARRLEALAGFSGKSVDELAREGLDSFAGSRSSRRTILKAKGAAAKGGGEPFSIADLGWLEGYAGQTIDELLLLEGSEEVHSILFAIEEAIQGKIARAGPGKMTGVELIVLSVLALDREVNNGGYDQYFRNSSRRFAPMIVNHLARIGSSEMADVTQEALDSLGVSELSTGAIKAAMAAENVKRDRMLNRCDMAFYETESPLKLTARGRSRLSPQSQAKTPAPQRQINDLQSLWSRPLACADFCHGLLI